MPRPAAAGAPRLVKVADRRAAAGPHLARLLEPAAVASGPRPVGAADDPAPAVAAAAAEPRRARPAGAVAFVVDAPRLVRLAGGPVAAVAATAPRRARPARRPADASRRARSAGVHAAAGAAVAVGPWWARPAGERVAKAQG